MFIQNNIQVNTYPTDFITISRNSDNYQTAYNISLNQKYIDLFDWVEKMKAGAEKEAQMRAQNPSLNAAYESYVMMLKLVASDTK